MSASNDSVVQLSQFAADVTQVSPSASSCSGRFRPFTILVSSAGRRNKLISCFRESARHLGVKARIIATDMNPAMSPACHEADVAVAVPRCTAPEFDTAVKSICATHKVDLIIPTIDTELAYFAREKNWFHGNGTAVNISSPEVVGLARDKLAFQRFLERAKLPAPAGGEAGALTPVSLAALPWPCIFKPRDGSRSLGIVRASSPSEVPSFALAGNYLWQECWRGREFTVAFYVGRDGRCRCVLPYERVEVRDGEISKGVTRRVPVLEAAVRRMAESLPGAYGAHCAQGIVRADGGVVLFELNARFGGGYPLADNAGATFARWLMEDALNLPSTENNDWASDRIMLRYDAAVFC